MRTHHEALPVVDGVKYAANRTRRAARTRLTHPASLRLVFDGAP